MKTLELIENVVFGKVIYFRRSITFHLFSHKHVIYRVSYLDPSYSDEHISTCCVDIISDKRSRRIENVDLENYVLRLMSMC